VPELSDRLRNLISERCAHLDDAAVQSLAVDVRHGAYPWFVDEFAAAIRDETFTPELWRDLVDVERTEETDDDLRAIWSQVAPELPYPRDELGVRDGIRWSAPGGG
jgi:hypothetical protein